MEFQFVPIASRLVDGHCSVFFTPSHQIFIHINKIAPAPFPSSLFSKLNGPSSRSLSSHERCSSQLIIFMALHWACSSKSISSHYWGAQHLTWHSRCGFFSAEQRGRITSLDLLTTFSLMQPRRPVSPKHAAGSCSAWCPPDPQVLFRQAAGANQLESNY